MAVASRMFGGKRYVLKAREHTKSLAKSYAKRQRVVGKSARVTRDKSGGHSNYDVWVR